MLSVDSITINSGRIKELATFLVHVFEMEVINSSADSIELMFNSYRIRLIFMHQIAAKAPLLLKTDDLQEIDQIKKRAEFFYFTHKVNKPEMILEDRLSDEQVVRFFDPESRIWEILFFC